MHDLLQYLDVDDVLAEEWVAEPLPAFHPNEEVVEELPGVGPVVLQECDAVTEGEVSSSSG